jgi:hypothetical protein
VTRHEQNELYRLVGQAWELRGSPYYVDALQAIVDWHERRRLARLEREREETGRLVLLLRETGAGRAA